MTMNSSIAIPKPPYSIRALPVLVALVAVFVFGAVSGYLVRPAGTSAPSAPRAVSACPAGMHAEVWYTAHAWSCVADATS